MFYQMYFGIQVREHFSTVSLVEVWVHLAKICWLKWVVFLLKFSRYRRGPETWKQANLIWSVHSATRLSFLTDTEPSEKVRPLSLHTFFSAKFSIKKKTIFFLKIKLVLRIEKWDLNRETSYLYYWIKIKSFYQSKFLSFFTKINILVKISMFF